MTGRRRSSGGASPGSSAIHDQIRREHDLLERRSRAPNYSAQRGPQARHSTHSPERRSSYEDVLDHRDPSRSPSMVHSRSVGEVIERRGSAASPPPPTSGLTARQMRRRVSQMKTDMMMSTSSLSRADAPNAAGNEIALAANVAQAVARLKRGRTSAQGTSSHRRSSSASSAKAITGWPASLPPINTIADLLAFTRQQQEELKDAQNSRELWLQGRISGDGKAFKKNVISKQASYLQKVEMLEAESEASPHWKMIMSQQVILDREMEDLNRTRGVMEKYQEDVKVALQRRHDVERKRLERFSSQIIVQYQQAALEDAKQQVLAKAAGYFFGEPFRKMIEDGVEYMTPVQIPIRGDSSSEEDENQLPGYADVLRNSISFESSIKENVAPTRPAQSPIASRTMTVASQGQSYAAEQQIQKAAGYLMANTQHLHASSKLEGQTRQAPPTQSHRTPQGTRRDKYREGQISSEDEDTSQEEVSLQDTSSPESSGTGSDRKWRGWVHSHPAAGAYHYPQRRASQQGKRKLRSQSVSLASPTRRQSSSSGRRRHSLDSSTSRNRQKNHNSSTNAQVKNQQQQQTSKPLHAITEANTYSTHKPVEERSPHSFSSREQAPDHREGAHHEHRSQALQGDEQLSASDEEKSIDDRSAAPGSLVLDSIRRHTRDLAVRQSGVYNKPLVSRRLSLEESEKLRSSRRSDVVRQSGDFSAKVHAREDDEPPPNRRGSSLIVAPGRRESSLLIQSPPKAASHAGTTGLSPPSTRPRNSYRNEYVLRPDPGKVELHPTATGIQVVCGFNVVLGTMYLAWRVLASLEDLVYPWYSYIYLGGELLLTLGVWGSHAARMFPSIRPIVRMDDMVEPLEHGNKMHSDFNHNAEIMGRQAKIAILLPTAGEKLSVLLKALLGCYSQELWHVPEPSKPSDQLRILVLDEKRRGEVVQLLAWVYSICELLQNSDISSELQSSMDRDISLSPIEFWSLYESHRFSNLDGKGFSQGLIQCFEMARCIEDLISAHDDKFAIRVSSIAPRARKGSIVDSSSIGTLGSAKVPPGHLVKFDQCALLPTAIYFTRKNSGQPTISPKAGNMNEAVFNLADPNSPALIGDAKIVVVNDARHQLMPQFLQRTVPYFFELRNDGCSYRWGQVAFVQTPQRFPDLGDHDPLGNHALVNFSISNVGKDGVGGVLSCGQGSLWRVDALSGMDPDGSLSIDWKKKTEHCGVQFGFRSQVLIEDTHTSLELMAKGWRSAYVAEKDEVLALCTQQPDTVAWRVKQIFRWHIGAVQLLFLKRGLGFLFHKQNRWPTVWHRVYIYHAMTYYIQSLGGLVLIMMPIMFGLLRVAPFKTGGIAFPAFFFPYLITALVPTSIAMAWKGVHSDRVVNDEQFWIATCYVETWTMIRCATGQLAVYLGLQKEAVGWNAQCPSWPIPLLFSLEIAGAFISTYVWITNDFEEPWVWISAMGAAFFMAHLMWPMFSKWSGIKMPPLYYLKLVVMIGSVTLVAIWMAAFS